MASVNNGNQLITFKYQQEGTAQGFDGLLSGVIPTGIIRGGEYAKVSDSQITLSQMEMMINADNVDNVLIHVKTQDLVTVDVGPYAPYVIATFDWVNATDNYVDFKSVDYTELSRINNPIIFGKCEFRGGTLQNFDKTRKSWSPLYLNNEFQPNTVYGSKPNFLVSCREDGLQIFGFVIGQGKAIIDGKEVEITPFKTIDLVNDDDSSELYINTHITEGNGRIDIVVLKNDGNVDYIMGEESENPVPPIFPSYGLVLAKFTYTQNIIIEENIRGSCITNIYNNNYIATSSTVGRKVGSSIENPHTLYL